MKHENSACKRLRKVGVNALQLPIMSNEWWRSAVIYQIYPRSFADLNGDGIGDLPGITSRLEALGELGINAVWLSPFMASPQKDAGYDVADYCSVDPIFGTLADFDRLLATAHGLGIRVIIDMVPNHSSDQHVWFQQALSSAPGSAERGRYLFRDGTGKHGELPPNNWYSVFGGPAWTRITEVDGSPGQWYLHLFDSSQPDFDWTNSDVRAEFERTLAFWLDRGVDGFRVDVAHGLVKAEGLPDWAPPIDAGSMGGGGAAPSEPAPYWAQDGVHEIYRDWRALLDSYPGERILAAEAWVDPLERTALWVRPDEMHQAFNFAYLESKWNAEQLRDVIDTSLATFGAVGAPATWVLSNHDVVRHATRLVLTEENLQGHGIGPKSTGIGDPALGLRRARAATALMLALPGGAYLYQGEELGLPEVIQIPDEARQDPTWARTGGERYGRDGCRVPIPWEAASPAYGFNQSGESWLPQPAEWAGLARDAQRADPSSTLHLYAALLKARREYGLGTGVLTWGAESPDLLDFTNGAVRVIANFGCEAAALPASTVIASSIPLVVDEQGGVLLPADATVWLAV